MSLTNDIQREMERQETQRGLQSKNAVQQVIDQVALEDDEGVVDIITYVRASWGLNETPYPIQRFILKLIYGLPLDNTERDIQVWDRFRENLICTYTEEEMLDYLFSEGRCSISKAEYMETLGKIRTRIVLRLGRRGTKTSMSQWIAAYEIYKLLRKKSPQTYYRLRHDQPIRVTLIATGLDQAQELLQPARAAIKRSPFLQRFVDPKDDSTRRIGLNTQYNMDHGLGSDSGIHVTANPCSAKSVRGPANILVLLEEYGSFFWELQGSNKSDLSIWRAVAPSTGDFTSPLTGEPEGRVIIISTPLSRESHMHSVEEQIRSKSITGGLVLHIPSYWVNPLLSTNFLRDEYNLDKLGFNQEYGAEYLDQVESAFTRDDLEGCRVDPGPESHILRPGEVTYMGVDLGLRNDGTTITIGATNSQGESRIVSQLEFRSGLFPNTDVRELDIEEMAKEIDKAWDYWGCKAGIADQWNCQLPSTYVTLDDGIQKRLDRVKKEDFVLSGEGEFRRVKYVFSKEVSEDIYDISIEGSENLECLGEHRYRVYVKGKERWEWKLAKEVKVGDLLQTPILVPEQDYTELTEEKCELMGWYLAEGYSEKTSSGSRGVVSFVLNADEVKEKERIKDLLVREFPVEVNERTGKEMVPREDRLKNGCVNVRYTNKKAFEFFTKECLVDQCEKIKRKPAACKHLIARWLTLPIAKQRVLVKAFWKGDGYVNMCRKGTLVTALASYRLIDQLQLICHRLGGHTSQRHTYKRKRINQDLARGGTLKSTQYEQLQHWLQMGAKAAQFVLGTPSTVGAGRGATSWKNKVNEGDRTLFRKVTKVDKRFYTGLVYDLEIDEDHSYVANGVTSHNSFGLKSYLKSGARQRLEFIEFSRGTNDRLARHMIAVISQKRVEIYEPESAWEDRESIISEFSRLQRHQSGGSTPKIWINAPNVKGFHDDKYSSISRALWAAKAVEEQGFGLRAEQRPDRIKKSRDIKDQAEARRRHNRPSVRDTSRASTMRRFKR